MSYVHKMVSMEYDDEDRKDEAYPSLAATEPTGPQYPYGLRICLTHKEIRKLGLDLTEAQEGVGGILHGHFIGRITSSNINNDENGCSCRIEIQIEDLEIESEDAENDEADNKS